MSDNELGKFLRSRREAVTPGEVGLPAGPRRRTPGLRRAELATLAGVSVDYLTRLEQGRDRHPSATVLGALGTALRLSPEERMHLRHLAKLTSGTHNCFGAEQPAREVRPTVRALLDRLEPAPAVVVNRLTEVLASTTGYERLVGPLGVLDTRPANLARFVFTDARARDVYPDWDRVADGHVAALKLEPQRDDPHVAALIDDLTVIAGAPFTDRLATSTAVPQRAGTERLLHPDAGELRLAYETLELPAADGQRLLVYLPADDATAAALDGLTGRQPGNLRAVTA